MQGLWGIKLDCVLSVCSPCGLCMVLNSLGDALNQQKMHYFVYLYLFQPIVFRVTSLTLTQHGRISERSEGQSWLRKTDFYSITCNKLDVKN